MLPTTEPGMARLYVLGRGWIAVPRIDLIDPDPRPSGWRLVDPDDLAKLPESRAAKALRGSALSGVPSRERKKARRDLVILLALRSGLSEVVVSDAVGLSRAAIQVLRKKYR